MKILASSKRVLRLRTVSHECSYEYIVLCRHVVLANRFAGDSITLVMQQLFARSKCNNNKHNDNELSVRLQLLYPKQY